MADRALSQVRNIVAQFIEMVDWAFEMAARPSKRLGFTRYRWRSTLSP